MTSTELQIKNIVYEEFSKLISNIEGDFKTNFVKKRYNFLLSQLDETITANMVFVSSFESKSGFAIETCAKRIARLKFGDENVPAIVNPRNVKHNINPNTISGQIIVTDIDTDNGELRGNISTFRATNVAAGKGSSRSESGVTQTSIKSLLPMAQKYKASGYHTNAKYREGDPEELSMYGIRQSKLDIFYDFIIQCLDSGWSKSKTIKEIYTKGYTGSKSNVFDYLCKIEQKENRYFEVQPYIQTMTEALKYRTGSIGKEKDYITREGIFRYMWMNTELTVAHKNFIYDQYPAVQELHRCIKEFRNIFKKRNIPLLYLFIEKYCKSELKALKSFAEGLKRDIDAIENAVAYDYSNGFVEGTNSRLKMIKRTMYGRC